MIVVFACLLIAAGALMFWRAHERWSLQKKLAHRTVAASVHSSSTAPNLAALSTAATNAAQIITASARTNPFAYRLSNTAKSIGQLTRDRNAILLENALIDSSLPLNFSIPKNLQSQGDPGAYIVQARGTISSAFRAMLAQAGAQIVSYIPNNAYLVTVSTGGANEIRSSVGVQSVIPYEPYYKIQSSLLAMAVEDKPLPPQTLLNLGLFGDAQQAISQIEKLGEKIVSQGASPFGPVVVVQPPQNWTALAQLPGVQIVEPFHPRVHANDLSRATVGVATDTRVATNYLGLDGHNVMVEVNDSGIDALHPDLVNRVFGSPTNDTDGHGTHVAGIIAGSGAMSTTVANAEGSIIPAAGLQFRGMASNALLFAMDFTDSDRNLQEAAALTNALISNNSWNFDGDNAYDLAAASYDAATRDALPQVTGSQPVLFVFAAGNSGSGNNSGGGGFSDTILSPATAKNVITVGAIEQLRNITNIVTDASSNQSAVWQPMTDSSFQVAGFSSRGNVGIGTEGTSGRFKPDVVAPGTFVISTRSEQWLTNVYYNPTNDHVTAISDILDPGTMTDPPLDFFVFKNAVEVDITATQPNGTPFVPLPINVWQGTDPNTQPPTTTGINSLTISGGALTPVNTIWSCAVSNTTASALSYNLTVDVKTTNDLGNYFQVLEGMNDSLGGFYRYESGTSMSAADVSGVLALMQDYFTNKLQLTPSPALLKALLISGARPTGNYNLNVQNAINYEGWGLISLPNSLPTGVTNQLTAPSSAQAASFFVDQSPTNALATGDSHKFTLNVSTNASTLRLRVTVAWTDPPGNPSAAIKLVNNLDLVVSNMDTGDTYFGNDIPAGSIYNNVVNTNTISLTNFVSPADSINNIERVILPPLLSGNYTVTIIGKSVNVNAVTAHINNVVQDYALVISCGEGEVPDAITLTDNGIISNSTNYQDITYVTTTNTPLFNQFVGASSPLLGTNQISVGTNTQWNSNGVITLGQTNQWHFYVVTNTTGFTNAAFITFLPPTLSVPRMGVFADSDANATRPEADIDLYVSTNSALTNLDPTVIAAADKSVGRGGTEFVTYNNSVTGMVYYVGVKSEDQMASEYAFIPIFTQIPFGQSNTNGDQIVNGVPVPVNVPDGSPAHPQVGYMFAIALQPEDIERVIVTTVIQHQNFGDLVGTLTHNNQSVVLNNHDEPNFPPPPGPYTNTYDDSGTNGQPADGPGSLNDYSGQPAFGLWILSEVDNSQTQTGSIQNFSILIQKHQPLTSGKTNTVAANSWFTDFVDVPAGATNLTISVTNLNGTLNVLSPSPLEVFVKFAASQPTTNDFVNNFDKMMVVPATTPPPPPGSSLSIGPSDVPPIQPGRYWIGVFNPNVTDAQTFSLFATLAYESSSDTLNFSSGGPATILDDAVNYSTVFVGTNLPVASVNVGIVVQHPRISDLVFHLISPDGTRVLLMENRGGADTNGAGVTLLNPNTFPPVSSSGGPEPQTNIVDTGVAGGSVQIDYDFLMQPDEMTIYYESNQIFDSGMISNNGTFFINYGPGTSTLLTIIMNQNTNPVPTTKWTYTVHAVETNYLYLTFTEDTNLTTTPIKYAAPPFLPNTNTSIAFTDNFDADALGTYSAPAPLLFGWIVLTNQVDIVDNPTANSLPNLMALDNGAVSNNLPVSSGLTYVLSFAFATNNGTATVNWQTNTVTFTATQNGEPLVLDASGGGFVANSVLNETFETNALFDDFILTQVPGNLYYLPEQSLDAFTGENAFGNWQLEIQDDRAGGGLTNSLVSWQLQFVFANTNAVPASVSGGLGQTNSIGAGDIAWFQINVPTNATIATNLLLFASAPVNVWFDTNSPPTTNIPLMSGTSGSTLLSTTNAANLQSPPNIYEGQTYYLGVQNTNSFTVNYGIEVDFDHGNATNSGLSSLVISSVSMSGSATTLNWTASPSAQFQVQWTDDLTQPWNTDPQIITSGNGNFTFTDDGSQTAPLGAQRFYRLVQISP